MHSWKKSNSKFMIGDDTKADLEDENKKKAKVLSKLTTPKRQILRRD